MILDKMKIALSSRLQTSMILWLKSCRDRILKKIIKVKQTVLNVPREDSGTTVQKIIPHHADLELGCYCRYFKAEAFNNTPKKRERKREQS